MNILFLDIDGVLNTSNSWDKPSLDQDKLALLVDVVVDTGCRVVVSSAWRWDHTLDDLRGVLLLDDDQLIDVTPTLPTHSRDDEIKQWLDQSLLVDKFVIVDDEPYNFTRLSNHVVTTEPSEGLTKALAKELKARLS